VLAGVAAFAIFAAVVLLKASAMLEPDDFAYRASIVALSHGHILLTNAQYLALQRQLSAGGGRGILQWHHLVSGRWISEKNPGYPFFAVLFYMIGALRVAPLFYGVLGCVGLFYGRGPGSGSGRAPTRSGSTASREPHWSSRGAPRCPASPTRR